MIAKEEKHKHIMYVKGEREFVESERFRISTDSNDFYFEIDGMDQSKTNLPHWPNPPKDVNKDLLMQIHVTAARYADGRPADIYMYKSTFAHDSDCTCTIIYTTVIKVTKYQCCSAQLFFLLQCQLSNYILISNTIPQY